MLYQIDKSWTTLANRFCDEYRRGVNEFKLVARGFINSEGKTKCPCRKCINQISQSLDQLENHLYINGFQQAYKVWIHHGEDHPPLDPIVNENEAIVEDDKDNGVGDTVMDKDDVNDDTEDMIPLFEDIEGVKVSNDPQNGNEDIPQSDAPKGLFNTSLLEEKLYPGSKSSLFNFIVKLMHLKIINKWSNKSFSMLLKELKEHFPEGCKIPIKYYDAKTMLSKLGLGYQQIHVCKYDCCLYWKENEELDNCPICHESRWVDKNAKGKKVPHKVMRYFPLTQRLQRLYRSRHTANDMRWHEVGRPKDNDVLRHPADGEAWKNLIECI